MLNRKDWNPRVKDSLNQLISQYHDQHQYVVFDFDNTCSIFDSEEAVMKYQLDRFLFQISEEEFNDLLYDGLKDDPRYDNLVTDLIVAFRHLDDPKYEEEFKCKMLRMYSLIDEIEGASVAYPWVCYWFTGMSEQEAYDLSYEALEYYASIPTTKREYSTSIASKYGNVSYTLLEGISISENMKELFEELSKANIDIWINSASHIDVVRAALDYFDLSQYITGLIAMTCDQEDDRYILSLHPTGYYYLYDQGWIKKEENVYSLTQGIGKVKAIQDVLIPRYHCGPLAGFMDSTGDYEFCTLFKDTKLVVCFNRADRSINDGGGMIGIVAKYQEQVSSIDTDTLYVLQGRDENNMRGLIDSDHSRLFGSDQLQLFKNNDNEQLLQELLEKKPTIEEIINTYAFNFLSEYPGYHTL